MTFNKKTKNHKQKATGMWCANKTEIVNFRVKNGLVSVNSITAQGEQSHS
jgi:hypothetical protein